jgi:hypothetical protein
MRRTGNTLTRETLEYEVAENSTFTGGDIISPTADGSDYTGQAVFEVGEWTAYIRIPIVNDNLAESTEMLSAGL